MTVDTTPRAGRREWIGLAVIALPCLLYSMDLTVLELAVPTLSADLAPTSTQMLWIMDIYGFLIAGLLITMGTLGDRIGRRRLLLIGACAFGAASLLAAYATTAAMLIAARAVLGIAGATLAPSTLSLIRAMFIDPRQRTVAVAVWATSFSTGAAIGPLAGGVLLEFFWWGSVFLLALPVMVLLLVLGPALLPEYRDPAAGRLDPVSAVLSLVAVLAVISGLKEVAQHGIAWMPALSVVAGVAVGVAFVRRQRHLADPMIDLRLFRSPAFSTSLAAIAVSLFVIAGMFFFIAQYLQLVLGLSPLRAGLWTVPSSIGLVAGSMLAPVLARLAGPAAVIAGGMALAATGLAALTQVTAGGGLAILVVGSVLLTLGAAPVGTLATDLVVSSAPPERAGAASGISETGAELGGALGIAILGSIGTAVYRAHVAGAMSSAIAIDVARPALDTLGGAVAAAAGLPERTAAALLDAGRAAFTEGLQTTAAVSAAVALALAVLAAVLLRHVRPGGEVHDTEADVTAPPAAGVR